MIEVEEYVRTKDGVIDKVQNYSFSQNIWHCENGMCIDECNCIGTYLEDIVKHSKIISEVVEVGDYVNGYKVISIDTNAPNDCKECIELDRNNTYEYQWISKNEIETILTKEQYQANCYTVERKKEC